MFEQTTVLLLLGGLFLLIIIVAIFMQSKGQYFGDVPTKPKFSNTEAFIFIVGFIAVMLLTIYQKGNGQ